MLARNKSLLGSVRAEEKPRGAVTIAIITFGIVIVGILVYIMLTLSTKTSAQVLSQQREYTLTSTSVVKALFAMTSLKYADTENASCALAQDYERPASIVLRMKPYEVPESCSIFVDSVLVKTERRLEPDCTDACAFQEFDRGIAIGNVDYRDDHTVRVCCNSICVEDVLPGLCGAKPQPTATEAPSFDKKAVYLAVGVGLGVIVFVAIILIVARHHQKL